MSTAKLALFVALGVVTLVFVVAWIRAGIRGAGRVRPTGLLTAVGFVTNFFDTLGIGSFAPTTSVFKLKRLVPGGSITLQLADGPALDRAAGLLPHADRNDDTLTLQVPDAGVRALRGLLDRLDAGGVEVAQLSVQTPELDDVFLALTGRPERTLA